MSEERCPECGAAVSRGLAGCQAAWDEFSMKAYSDPEYAALHDLAFDAYCMQHPEQYGRSAKSYAAHLTRLCCGLEYNRDPAVYAAIRKWLDGKVALDKPSLLSERGDLTIVDALAARNPLEHARLVEEWARSVWEAYTEQHELARDWIRAAVETYRR
jgi:hypothetical protein